MSYTTKGKGLIHRGKTVGASAALLGAWALTALPAGAASVPRARAAGPCWGQLTVSPAAAPIGV